MQQPRITTYQGSHLNVWCIPTWTYLHLEIPFRTLFGTWPAPSSCILTSRGIAMTMIIPDNIIAYLEFLTLLWTGCRMERVAQCHKLHPRYCFWPEILLSDITFQIAAMPMVAADTSLYSLSSKEAAFFKAQIGINDDEDLKRHILKVQAKAYEASHS